MSDTPMTGALLESILRRDRFLGDKNAPEEWVVHARQLERELAAANKERDDALMMLGVFKLKSDDQIKRIQRLVEAGDAMHETLSNPWNGGSSSNPECETWTAAKEENALLTHAAPSAVTRCTAPNAGRWCAYRDTLKAR